MNDINKPSRFFSFCLIISATLPRPVLAQDSCCELQLITRSSPTLFQWTVQERSSQRRNLNAPLVTDRPDFTEASSTVGLGISQLEFGYTFTHNNDGRSKTRSNSLGEPLFRHGIYADWLELRIAVTPQNDHATTPGGIRSNSGMSDLYLGFKIALTPQTGHLPEMAIIPQANVPTGGPDFTSGAIEPGLNWIYSWEINDFISTGGSTQGNHRIDEIGSSYLEMAQSWTIACQLTEELGVYTEWYGFMPYRADTTSTQHYLNGGFTYLLSDHIQFDIRAGLGLSNTSDDYFLGTGLSIRFP